MTDHRLPRVLLVEDDPVSAAFLEAALGRVPAQVTVAHSCASARERAAADAFDLWVFDAHLPDGHGDLLLRELRAAGGTAPAIAHTAAREASAHERLLAAGFREVLVKPLSMAETLSAVRHALGLDDALSPAPARSSGNPFWDDDAALQALLGDRDHLVALRGLFRPELGQVRAAVADAVDAGDLDALRALLHRLRASCGFVGAARLGEAAATLASVPPREGWAAFDRVVQGTLDSFPAA